MLAQSKDTRQERRQGLAGMEATDFCLSVHDFFHPSSESLTHRALHIMDPSQGCSPLCSQSFGDSI